MIEAMKMELPVVSTISGKVTEIYIAPDGVVESSAVMAVIQKD